MPEISDTRYQSFFRWLIGQGPKPDLQWIIDELDSYDRPLSFTIHIPPDCQSGRQPSWLKSATYAHIKVSKEDTYDGTSYIMDIVTEFYAALNDIKCIGHLNRPDQLINTLNQSYPYI